jgi:hypothetical protein
MPNNEELIALAERVEAASGPDRELDAAINTALRLGSDWSRGTPEASRVWALHFTASLDAAMTLVPEPQSFTISHCGNTCARVQIIGGDPCSNDPEFDGDAASPALALAAASLRALAAARIER